MKLRYKLLVVFGLVCLWLYGRGCDKRKDAAVTSRILDPNTLEKIIVNPHTHTITSVTAGKTTTETLPNRPSSIEVLKNGQVKITSSQFGTEREVFTGLGWGGNFRVYIGGDLFYFKKFDIGPFVSFMPVQGSNIRLGAAISYNFWSNTRLSIGIDHTSNPNVMLTFRI